jgi:hypothetical protein
MTSEINLPAPAINTPVALLDQLAEIPEEEVWLAIQKSARTRRAYRLDVRHFMATLAITTSDELRRVDHRAVIAWERIMRETEHSGDRLRRDSVSPSISGSLPVALHANVGSLCREGVARPEQRPNIGGEFHAATGCGRWLK